MNKEAASAANISLECVVFMIALIACCFGGETPI